MTTTVIKVRGVEAPAGLPVIDVTDTEYSIVAMPSLLEWFRADVGVSGLSSDFRWSGRKYGYQLSPSAANAPTKEASVQNGKPALLFNVTTSGDLYDSSNRGLWPANSDYTVIAVASVQSGDNAVIVGTDASDNGAYILVQGGAAGAVQIVHSGGAQLTASNSGGYADGTMILITASYSFAAKTLQLSINKTDVKNLSAVPSEVSPAKLRIGAAGPVGAAFGGMNNGHVAEVLTFNSALHVANPTLLSDIQDYLIDRYAIS